MGFGLICAGYSTLIFLRLIPVELVGFVVVLMGLNKLKGFNKYFAYTKNCVYGILVFSLADAIYWILKYFGIINLTVAEDVFTYLHRLVFLPFYILLFMALRTISRELEYIKGMKRSTLALSTTIVYYLVFALSRLNINAIREYLFAAEAVLYLVLFLVAESAVYVCYRAITTDEAEKQEEERLAQFEQRFGKKKDEKKASKSKKK
ncbi:MAG: hypothetical protein IKI97_06740 [Clostridia bacterium]|nr:hypothetical protein [Clostridia bacterium]